MKIIYKLSSNKKPKSRVGILYLLISESGIYKYGYTRNNVLSRRNSAQRKYSEKFNIIATRIVNKPHKTENNLRWALLNDVDLLENSTEFFRLSAMGLLHKEVLNIFGEVNETYRVC